MVTMTGPTDVGYSTQTSTPPPSILACFLIGARNAVLGRVRGFAWRVLDMETTFEFCGE